MACFIDCRVRNYKLRFPHNMVITGLLHRFSNAGGSFSVQKGSLADQHGRPQAAKKSPVGSFLVFGSHPVGMSNVVAAAAFARGIFNLTRTGIAAELTAASEQRLPPVGGRCRIATKRGVQGSEAGAVVSGMRTPLQGVKHTLGTTTRDRAAVRLHLEYHMPFYG